MKKLAMTGASILALSMAGTAMAQSVSAPADPRTPDPAPVIEDCPPGANNCSIIEQSGANNTATLTQTGDGNTSNIEQDGSGATGNAATVTQSGNNNDSDIDQINGSARGIATVTQSGDNAASTIVQDSVVLDNFPTRATVQQTGDGASSVIFQLGTRNSSVSVVQDGDNDSYVEQSVNGFEPTATVRQSGGTGNNAFAIQEGDRVDLGNGNTNGNGITQNGNDNFSDVFQLAGSRFVTAQTDQEGDRNDSIIIQSNNGNVDARVDQLGDDNISSIVQTGVAGNGIFNGVNVDIIQSGSDNLSRVEQNNVTTGADASGILVEQNEDGNDSFISQSSGTGRAQVTQTSTDTSGMVLGTDGLAILDTTDPLNPVFNSVRANYSNIVQDGAERTEITVDQTGFGNRSDARQTNNNAGGDAIAFVTQNGTGNNSDIDQDDASMATVRQGVTGTSTDNISYVFQLGAGDIAFVDQIGESNFSQINQNGAGGGNDANVNQDGVFSESGIEQTGTLNDANVFQQATSDTSISVIFQDGTSNTATVTQAGTGDFSTVSQTGTSNTATVNQGPVVP
ncbi:Curlin-associated protein [Erythrobacter sp. NAP1]|uniref:beta strand repeat-containing protein n=1 Tax=Erythrobacter sp. NAP1 TaxID=237727 RepID=UPI0000687663|nr:Curlin-associated protein [Erythrobacter sp. NAP1]EAQ28009.1 Curlin-associated protein [Erythrobacter sp. NAP1]